MVILPSLYSASVAHVTYFFFFAGAFFAVAFFAVPQAPLFGLQAMITSFLRYMSKLS